MKRLALISGLLSGIFVAVILLLNNPFASQDVSGAYGSNAYHWQALEFVGNDYAPTGFMGLPAGSGREELGADEVALANASILLLQDANGTPMALATRLSSISKGGDLLFGNIGTDTYTNIFWPNRGSLFLQGYENRWPFIRRKILAAFSSSSKVEFPVSADGQGVGAVGIVGGSGNLIALGGRYSETLREDTSQPGGYVGSIALEMPDP